jgi:hypothetical protein
VAQVEPIAPDDLAGYLPAPPTGWEGGTPHQSTFDEGGYVYSYAERQYRVGWEDGILAVDGYDYATVYIYDSAYNYALDWWRYWDNATEFDTADGYAVTLWVYNYPAWEMYDAYALEEPYSRVVFLQERFMVIITADEWYALEVFTETVDFDAIAALAWSPVATLSPARTPTPSPEPIPPPSSDYEGLIFFGLAVVVIGTIIYGTRRISRHRQDNQEAAEARAAKEKQLAERISKKKTEIVDMIGEALAVPTAGHAVGGSAGDKVADHDWHDIAPGRLPNWVKERASELDKGQLKGRSFEYRRTPDGRLQRRLRRKPNP